MHQLSTSHPALTTSQDIQHKAVLLPGATQGLMRRQQRAIRRLQQQLCLMQASAGMLRGPATPRKQAAWHVAEQYFRRHHCFVRAVTAQG